MSAACMTPHVLFHFGCCGFSVPSPSFHPQRGVYKDVSVNKLAVVSKQIMQIRFSIKILVLWHFGALFYFIFLSESMHGLCVFALIFSLLLTKSTMKPSRCVQTLYHHMSEPGYIFIHYFSPTLLLCPDNVTNGISSSSFCIFFSFLVSYSPIIMFL